MIVSWFSSGVSSFVATYLMRERIDKILYIHIEDQHPDTMRFLKDCEKHLGKEINILQSKYGSVDNVIRQFQFINSRYGAKCTDVLKKRVRKEWEKDKGKLTYIWGYDEQEQHRADRLVNSMPEHNHIFPLIEKGISKQEAHGIMEMLGIRRPIMYDLGYSNNNCIGCVKGGMGYWNKIRQDFPDVYNRMAIREREVGHTCINGVYLDELDPNQGRMEDEIMQECNIICQLNIGG